MLVLLINLLDSNHIYRLAAYTVVKYVLLFVLHLLGVCFT